MTIHQAQKTQISNGENLNIIHDHSFCYNEKVEMLKTRRDERTLFLHECCRDMDYINDLEMNYILEALHAVRNDPRRFQ